MSRHNYPETVAEVLDDNLTFKPETLRVVGEFKASRPWSGSLEERKAKFRRLNHELAVIYGIPEPELAFGRIDGSSSGSSCYRPAAHSIVMTGKLSVVTFLHEFCHARGMGERAACRWSLNLFRRAFPEQWGRLVHRGHMLVRPDGV